MFDRTWRVDTFERCVRAFLEGFLAVFVTVHLFDIDTNLLELAVSAGFTAAAAVLLSAVAGLNKKEGAGFLVETSLPDDPVPQDKEP